VSDRAIAAGSSVVLEGAADERSALAAQSHPASSSPPSTSCRASSARALTEADLGPLFERWQRRRDQRARELLVERYMPLARSLARRYLHTREPIDDLTQVAYLGLIKAIDRFDAARGSRFASYAVPTILGELRRHFRDTVWAVHVPRGAQERAHEVERATELLASKRGHPPTVGEIAEYLECGQEEVLDALQASRARSSLSLDAPAVPGDGEDAEPRVEVVGVEDEGYAQVEEDSLLASALSALPTRERGILRMRFRGEMTQAEIAAKVGLSQMQVSRILRRSLERMRAVAEGSGCSDDRAAAG
jgi:RNA polymerase sigma-B factor